MPPFRVFDRGHEHLPQTHRSEPFQQGDPSAEEPGRHPGLDAPCQLRSRELARVQRRRGRSGSVQRVDLAGSPVEYRHEAIPARTGVHRLHAVERREDRHRCVRGGTTLHEDSDPRHRRQWVT